MRLSWLIFVGIGVSGCGGFIPTVKLSVFDGRLTVLFIEQFDGDATINDRIVDLVRFSASCNPWGACGPGSARATLDGDDGFDPTVPIVLRASSGSATATYVFPPPADAVLEGGDTLQPAAINTLRVHGGFGPTCGEDRDHCSVVLEEEGFGGRLTISMTQTGDTELAVALPAMPERSVADSKVVVGIEGVRACEECDSVRKGTLTTSLTARTTF